MGIGEKIDKILGIGPKVASAGSAGSIFPGASLRGETGIRSPQANFPGNKIIPRGRKLLLFILNGNSV